MPNADPVGIPEIADRLNVQRETVDMWRYRNLLPDPDWTVGGRPAWDWSNILAWAKDTGRVVTRPAGSVRRRTKRGPE